MPITLGTRSRDNIQFGPVEIYIAEGGTISAPASYGTSITLTSMNNLLSSFTRLGELLENPLIETDPIADRLVDPDAPSVVPEQQRMSEVRAALNVVEMDNTLLNVLVTRAEAGTKTDFLWLRQSSVGEYADFIRNVPFLVAFRKTHTFEDVRSAEIRVNALSVNIRNVHGQYLITSNPS